MPTSGGSGPPSSSSDYFEGGGAGVARYVWARQFVEGQDIMDLGCGYGSGSDYLAESARTVLGVDTDSRAIRFAVSHYRHSNLSFKLIQDISEIENLTFDTVIALELIEHILEPQALTHHVRKLLRSPGRFILSTPNRNFTSKFYRNGKPTNPYHIHEFYPDEIQLMLSRDFTLDASYVQGKPLSPEELDARIRRSELVQTSRIPRHLRYFVPTWLKNIYLEHLNLPPFRNENWKACPISACNFESIGDWRVQLYVCTKKG